jgi:hypothetical protein
MYTLATLDQLRQRLGLNASDTSEDARLLDALQAASAQIEQAARRRFSPRLATIAQDVNPRYPQDILLNEDLLQIDAVSNGDGSSIDPLDLIALPDGALDGPSSVLRLSEGQSFTWIDSPLQAVSVTGLWGWHDRWSRAWRSSADTVQDNPLSSASTTLTVSDADGVDSHLRTPRFHLGHLLRIEDEYLRVLAVDTGANTMTVLRGVQGTTTAAHDQGTAISLYQPPLEVESLCLRWAAWLYKEPDRDSITELPENFGLALASLRREVLRS